MVYDLKSWAYSDYPCDRALFSHSQATQYERNSEPYRRYRISEKMYTEADKASPIVSLVDISSQVSKGIFELMLWPVFATGMVLYGLVSLPIKLIQGKADFQETGAVLLLAVFYPPLSAVNRVRLIAIDFFNRVGLITSETGAIKRQSAFQSFPCNGQSLLLFLGNVMKGNPYGFKLA